MSDDVPAWVSNHHRLWQQDDTNWREDTAARAWRKHFGEAFPDLRTCLTIEDYGDEVWYLLANPEGGGRYYRMTADHRDEIGLVASELMP